MRLWKSTSNEEALVFKIDFEKTYDHVDWDFFGFCVEKERVGGKMMNVNKGFLNSMNFSIVINGRLSGLIKASRGLKRCDLLLKN